MTPHSIIVLKHKFSAVRVFDYSLSPTNFELQVHCCVPNQFSPNSHSAKDRAAVSLQVLKLWMQNMLEEVTILNPTNEMGEFLLAISENKVMTTPGEPDDNILVQVLCHKISTITKGHIELQKIVLVSTDTDDTEQHLIITNDYVSTLPDINYMEEKAVHSIPWWERASIDISDIYAESLSDDVVEEILNSDDVLQEYEDTLIKELNSLKIDQDEAEIIEDVWKT